jgi:uncharacterized membrane protein
MKLNYHPPHLVLVHFPAALFPMDLVCAALAIYRHDQTFNYAGFYALGGGVVMGWLAVLFGFADLVKIPPERKAAQQLALIHGTINATLLIGYSVLFFLQWKAPEITNASLPQLVIKSFLLAGLIIGNYLGAQLVLKHKIGTINNSLTKDTETHAKT